MSAAITIPDDVGQEIAEVVLLGYPSERVKVHDLHRSSVIDVRASGTYEMPDGSVWAWCITEGPGAASHQWERDGEPMDVQPPDRGPLVAVPRYLSDDPWTWADAVLQTRDGSPAVQLLHDVAYDSFHAPGGRGLRAPHGHPLMLQHLDDVPARWRPLYTPATAGAVWAREVVRPAMGRLAAAAEALASLPPRPPFVFIVDPHPSQMFDAAVAAARHATYGDSERASVAVAKRALERASAAYLSLTHNDHINLHKILSETP